MTISAETVQPRSIATPAQHRSRAEQLRAAGKTERAAYFDKLADMIERRDEAISAALDGAAGEGEV